MNVKGQIPNVLTLGNLFCGTLATIFAVNGDFINTALFVVLGIFFDFFDGFVARLLKVQGELGKQLDSLADMVTSGVAPGIVMVQLLAYTYGIKDISSLKINNIIPYLGLLLTLFACYRLAKFNIDTRQSDSFIGLPTPAMSLFVVSLPLIIQFTDNAFFVNLIENRFFLMVITFLLSYVMVAELPLFSLKFKSFGFKGNEIKYLFLVVSLLLLLVLKFIALPIIILLYVLFSLVNNLFK